MKSGLGYVRHTPHVRALVVALSGLNLFISPVTAVGLALRAHHEGWGSTGLGVLTGGIGAGALAGTALMLRWRPRRPARTGLAVLLVQDATLVLAGFAPFPGAAVASCLLGITAGLASPMLAGVLQATIREEFLGRTNALLSLADSSLAPLALAGFGVLAQAAGVGVAATVCAGLSAVTLAGGMLRPEIRRR